MKNLILPSDEENKYSPFNMDLFPICSRQDDRGNPFKNFKGYENAIVRLTESLNLTTGRNSVGKASLLDSIVYGLFGTVPGVENRLLVSFRPTVKDAEVYLRFRSPRNNSRIEIHRRLEVRQGRTHSASVRFLADGKKFKSRA